VDADEAATLINVLKRGKHGWSTTLPAEAGLCLKKRIDVSVRSPDLPGAKEPPLTKAEIELLTAIFTNLPTLVARAEKAWEDADGYVLLDEEDRLSRPCIWINREMQVGKAAGKWTFVIGVAQSDYAWHVEFTRTKFKEIWSGD
jgi:hypothetical protein